MYTAVTIPKPNGSKPLTDAINAAVPPGKEIVAITVDGNNLIIVYK
jgi:hypothetical protein